MADQLADALARLTWLAERVDGSPRESCAEADAIADAFPTAPLVRVRRGLIAVAAHRAAGDHNAAGGEADAAVELAQKVRDTEGEGLVRLSRAAVRLRLGDVTGCSADLDTAETLLHGDHLVDVQVQRASVALQLGRLAEAEDGLRRTISLGNEHHRPREVARAQSNLGLLFVQEGRYGEAEEQLTAAARGFQSLGLPDGRLYAEHNLGYLRFCQGQLPEALGHFEQAEVAAASTGVFLPGLEIDRAEALAEAGLLSAAERTAGAAAERLSGMSHAGDGLPMEHSDALVIQSLALAAQGDVESAERVAAEALRVAQLVDRPRWHAVAKLALLTVQASDGWDSERSEDLAEIVRALDDAQAVHYLGHALVLAIIAEPGAQAAAKRIDRLRMIARRGDDRLRCRMHLAQALVHEHHGRRRSAQRSARAALAAASRAAGESGGLELRFSTTGLAREAARVGLRCSARRDARMWWNDRHESWSSVFPALRPEGDQELRNLGAAVRNAEAALRQHMQSETDPVEIASASAAVMTAERRMNAYARSRRATTPPEMHTRERPPAGYDIVSIGEYDGELVGFCRIDGRFIEHHLGLAAEARNLIHRVGLRAQRAIEAGRSAISGRELSDLDDLFKPLVKDAPPAPPHARVTGRWRAR
ncbi:MAG: tetratricopeptide repeat protein, partial [Actinomycetota bacterium]